jgi:signal transduction histidine kinase
VKADPSDFLEDPSMGASPGTDPLALFRDLTSLLGSPLKKREGWRPLLSILKRFIPFESATLFTVDAATGGLKAAEQMGSMQVELISPIRFDLGFGLSAWIAKRKTPIIIPRLRRFQSDPGGLHSYIGLPLRTDDRLLGVLNFGHSKTNAFAQVDRELLQVLAGQLSMLLLNLGLMDDLQVRNEQLQATNKELKALQGKLVEQERLQAIADVVATLNHEINNPLTIISGAAELLAMTLTDQDEKVHDKLTTILTQTRRLGRVLSLLAQMRNPLREAYPGGGYLLRLEDSSKPVDKTPTPSSIS